MDDLRIALAQAQTAIDNALVILADARQRIAPVEIEDVPPESPSAEDNFTPERYERADAARIAIENEIYEIEGLREEGELTETEAKTRLAPLEEMLEVTLRFMNDCRAALGGQARADL